MLSPLGYLWLFWLVDLPHYGLEPLPDGQERVVKPLNFRVPQPFDLRRVRVLTLPPNSFSYFTFQPSSSKPHFPLAFLDKL